MQKLKKIIRSLFKIPTLEKWIVAKTQGKDYNNFFVKLLPSNKDYPINTMRKAERGGIWYLLDISDYMEYTLYFGIQAEPRDRLYSLIKTPSIIIDIGTNIGETLLNFAKRNPSGFNYGFEPVPYLFERAKSNIALNNFKNIEVFNIALSDKEEILFFQEASNNNSSGTAMSKQGGDKFQIVQAISLDKFVEQNNLAKIDLIKIDVEGFEMNVLVGGKNSIQKYKPLLFIELDDNNLQKQNSSSKELVNWLKAIGYEIRKADDLQIINEHFHFEHTHFDIICQFL